MTKADIYRAVIAEDVTIGVAYGRVAARLGMDRAEVVNAYLALHNRLVRSWLRRDVAELLRKVA